MISRVDEILGRTELPELAKARPLLKARDTLITCAGFEDRALSFLERAVINGSERFGLVGISYRPEVAENRLGRLRELAAAAAAKETLITYDRTEAESSDDILRAARHSENVFVDISGMSRLLIVQLISAAVRGGLVNRVKIVYTEAASYPPTRQEFEEELAKDREYLEVLNFISSGVFGITVVPELSTIAMQGQPIRLIAFPSFNPAQFAAVCAETQASFYSIVNGCPPREENCWRRDAIRTLNNIDSLREKEEYEVSTFDYRETLKMLLEIYRKHGATDKLVVSPTGSKMQSVAVGIACGFLRDIQVVYPTPRSFPSPAHYTVGALDNYVLDLRMFGPVSARADRFLEAEMV